MKTDYSLKSIAFNFTSEQLHFDFETGQYCNVTKKTRRAFAGVSPFKAYRLLLKTEAEKGSVVTKVTAMHIRDEKCNWHTVSDRIKSC